MEGFSPPSPGIHTAPTCLTPGEEVEQKTTPPLSQLWAQTHSFVPHNADNMCFSESLKNRFFLLQFSYVCVICMWVYVCFHVWGHVWRPGVYVWNHPQLLFYLFTVAESLNQTQRPSAPASITNQLVLQVLCPDLWGWNYRQSSCFWSKCLNCRTISSYHAWNILKEHRNIWK